MPGRNRYQYVRRLGSGAHGEVVLASVQGTAKQFAVKCLSLSALSQRTLVEIQNHKKLVHPHVIRFEETFDDDDGLYIVMEYAELGDLLTYVQQQPHSRLSESEARWFFQQLIMALDYVHKMRIGHRDLKLENAMLCPNPADPRRPLLKLADFGLASTHVDTIAKSHVGTFIYMAPEVLAVAVAPSSSPATATAATSQLPGYSPTTGIGSSSDNSHYNPKRADIWSCGVMLYDMLVGPHTFLPRMPDGIPEHQLMQRIYERVLQGCPGLPDGLHVSDGCKDLLQRLLNPHPKKRITIEGILAHPWFRYQMTPEVLQMNEVYFKGVSGVGPAVEAGQSDADIAVVVRRALGKASEMRKQAFLSRGVPTTATLQLAAAGAAAGKLGAGATLGAAAGGDTAQGRGLAEAFDLLKVDQLKRGGLWVRA